MAQRPDIPQPTECSLSDKLHWLALVLVDTRDTYIALVRCGQLNWPGPALGEQDLRISDDLSQTALDVPLLSRPSVRCVPQVHGPMELAMRHWTIHFRAGNLNVAEQEVGNKGSHSAGLAAMWPQMSMCTEGVPVLRT